MKKISVLLLLILVVLLAGCQEEVVEKEVVFYSSEENEASYQLENKDLLLKMDGTTGYFELTDKNTGKVWYSNPVEAAEDTGADPSTRYAMLSSLVLTYVDKTGNQVIYDGYRYSLKEGTFQIFQEEDSLAVKYMVGLGKKFYIIPEVISVERMSAYMEQMDASYVQTILRTYMKLDLSKIKDPERVEQLLEYIPELADGPMYALGNATGGSAPNKYQLQTLEEAFASIGYTKEQALEDAAQKQEQTNAVLFNVTLRYKLDGDSLVVEVPEEEICYPAEHPISEIKVLPYFCSAGSASEGYLLVPDGGGGQIHFNNGKTLSSAYYSSIYGWDEAFDRPKRVQDPTAALPVFGMAADGHYMLVVAESGAAEMAVEADVSGKRSSYNYVMPIFTVVHGEDTTVSEKASASVRVFQSDAPDEVLTLRYFTGGSDSYVDMAMRYREYLMEKYPHLQTQTQQGIPVVVEFVGAIDQVEKILGIPLRQTMAAVDYREATQLVQKLSYIDGLNVRYTAVLNGGADQTVLFNATAAGVLGDANQRQAFLTAVENAGAKLYLDGYVQTVMNPEWLWTNSDVIRDTTNVVVKRYPYWQDMLTETEKSEDLIYLLNSGALKKTVATLAAESGNWGSAGVSFADIGNLLYSDFNRRDPSSRDDMLRLQQQLLSEIASDRSIMVSGGNDYAAVWADVIVDMDMEGGSYQLIDNYVPFYQIALRGLVTYTAEPLNASANYRQSLLKTVEYGAGLSYRFAETDYQELKGNRYTYQDTLFSANYANWEEELQSVYQRLTEELGHTVNMTIKDHCYITEHVTCTTYEDGTKVYVNYATWAFQNEDVTVAAEDWTVVKGG